MNISGSSKFGLAAFALAIGGMIACAAVVGAQAVADHRHHSESMQDCAKACSDCQRMCDSCATHCSNMLADGKHDHLVTVMTCRDCATMCSAAAQIVARGGPFSELVCQSCAEACSRCGKECEKFSGDEHMQKCAAECRKCEQACRAMAKELVLK